MTTNEIYYKNQAKHESGKPFTDPLFTQAEALAGLDTSNIEYKRTTELFGENTRFVLISDNMSMDDIIPGDLDDTYFLFCVQNLCKFKGNINNIFKKNGTFHNVDGYYELCLFIDDKEQIIIVDDYLPVKKGTKQLAFASSKKNEIWISLLEKAWAKVNGGYAKIVEGTPMEAFEFLTGFGSLIYDTEGKDNDDLNEYKIEIVNQLQNCDIEKTIISCTISTTTDVSRVGLISGYPYNLLGIYQIVDKIGNKEYLFRLRNPWSKGEWNGDWSDKSNLWDDNSKSKVKYLDKEDGMFYMSDNDFFKYFTHIEICYIMNGFNINKIKLTGEE